ncbi:hypothetical protein AQ962_17560 [Burkholderia pseudomallei]|nr:hypothetical protein AQ805_05690 [Burkholderia pseudomallei]OMW30509.1 hypothetical protein AQ804_11995 [Burkholderia pseudomallei]ONF07694.1 hypothetical protein AQ961_29630 [Burkholderia pseudomallei]ONF08142.1 hypothetical protein AQ962_17560 [Burkholderia pseudomallei]ONF28881.1 hypothetical protein AQ963_15535 [Burkholderia pseudomallei]
MLVQPFEVNFNVIQRAQLLDQLVGEREQFRLKGTDHLAICLLKLRCVDQLPFLFGQRQQFDFAIDALGHCAFGDQINARFAGTPCRHFAQVPDVGNPDLVDRGRAIIEPDLVDEPRNGRLIEIEMLGDLLLRWHEYDPPRSFTSREKARVRTPACWLPRRVPGGSSRPQPRRRIAQVQGLRTVTDIDPPCARPDREP